MGWFDSVTQVLRLFGQAQEPPASVTPPRPPPTGSASVVEYDPQYNDQYRERWNLSTDRISRYGDFAFMDQAGDIQTLLDACANAAMTWDDMIQDDDTSEMSRLEGCRIRLVGKYGSAGPRKVIERTLIDTQLKAHLWSIARDICRDGDVWTELVPDSADGAIVDLVQPPARSMKVGKDAKGRFLTGLDQDKFRQAYQQIDVAANRTVAGWDAWEMVHWKLYPTPGGKYSRASVLDSCRRDFFKLEVGEGALVEGRAFRSMPRMFHWYDATNRSEEAALDMIKRRQSLMYRRQAGAARGAADRGKLPSVSSDMVGTTGYMTIEGLDRAYPRLDKVEMFDPQVAGLSNTDDLKYFRRKMLNKVPGEIVGEFDQTRRDLSLQDIEFARFVKHLQRVLTRGVRQIVDTALLMAGYTNVNYIVEWPEVIVGTDWKYGDSTFRLAMAFSNFVGIGACPPWYAIHRVYHVPVDMAMKLAEDAHQWMLDHPTPTGVDSNNDGKVDDLMVQLAAHDRPEPASPPSSEPVNPANPGRAGQVAGGHQGG